MSKIIDIDVGECVYSVEISYALIDEIEEEMGSCLMILTRLQSCEWQVRDVIKLVHIVISQNETDMDFSDIADAVITAGATHFFDPLIKILMMAIFGLKGSRHD